MSHISRIKTKITNIEYLKQALNDLGYSYKVEKTDITGFGNRKVCVDLVVEMPMSYPIGFRNKNGGFEIVADWWGVRGVSKDSFISRLYQRYAYQAARGVLKEQGFELASEEVHTDGSIQLILRRMG